MLRAGRPGEVYNIGSGQPITNLQMVRHLLRLLHKSEDQIEFVADRPEHDRRYALETRKSLRKLDWRATIELHEGLLRTAEWYRANPEWVRKTKSGEYLTYYERFYANRQASLARI